jgi:hypothetical protein
MIAANSEFEQFFRYTSGRWLWDEGQQLQDRYRAFNVAGLQDLAAEAIWLGRLHLDDEVGGEIQ